MAAARRALHHHHGGQRFTFLQAERLEYQSGDGEPALLWDVQGWWGGDINKLWVKTEGECELLLTQRLILQGRAEVNLAAQDVPALDIGSGLSSVEPGMRLRYEWVREFAPYIGLSWTRAVGHSADFLRAGSNETDRSSVVAGIRLWF